MTRFRIPSRNDWSHVSPVWVGRVYVTNRCECRGRVKTPRMTDAMYCGVCHTYADHTGAPSAAMTVTYDGDKPTPDISMVTHPR